MLSLFKHLEIFSGLWKIEITLYVGTEALKKYKTSVYNTAVTKKVNKVILNKQYISRITLDQDNMD